MNRRFFTWFVAVDLLLLSLTVVGIALSAPPPPAGLNPTQDQDVRTQIDNALQKAVQTESQQVLSYLVYKTEIADLKLTSEQDFAALWLVMSDPQTGEGLPSEPGLAFAIKKPGSADWQIVLPSDSAWQQTLQSAPVSAVSPELKAEYLVQYQQFLQILPSAPLTGYLLPWPQGQIRYLSQSVLHDKYDSSHRGHYAFDFYLSGQMWNLYAAKSGTVWRVKYDVDTCTQPTCSSSQPLGNYIVLQDTTTVPTSYQLYLHLAKESIPPALRKIGTSVVQGQFLGVVDNTGQSWGHHLHFMVHTNPDSYWGQSVDITFADVAINGGRPRVKSQYYDDQPYCYSSDPCSQFSSSYVSGNPVKGDVTAPVGVITAPQLGDTVSAGSLTLSGSASDQESEFYSAQFVANYNNAWHEVGPLFTSSPFSYSWDFCSAGVPDGPVSVALRVMNKEGTQNPFAGLITFTKNYACPEPPPCTVDADHVALYEEANYHGCVVYGVGEYASGTALGNLGDDDAASIKVGANVQATLWSEANYQGRGTTFTADDPNLADNPIGAETTSSMIVQPRNTPPQPPALLQPVNNANIPGGDVVVFSWDNRGGDSEYQFILTGPTPITKTQLITPYLRLSGLAPGSYTWKVQAKNGDRTSESLPQSFTVLPPSSSSPSGTTLEVPLLIRVNKFEPDWQAAGLWRIVEESGDYRWWFRNASGNYSGGAASGTLTSPPITIPGESHYYLRFASNRQTEAGLHWDQRWLQISQDSGPFLDVLQMNDDPYETWTHSPYIDLSEYAGHSIRLRFAFATMDSYFNSTLGWGIDDISINADPPPACASPEEPNDSPGKAAPLGSGPFLPGQTLTASGTICPPGDVDYFQFDYEGPVPITIVADIDAQSLTPAASDLDGVLYLLDENNNVLAMHDDEVYAVKTDPRLAFRLTHTGRYYLKLIDWSHPGRGDESYFYNLRLMADIDDPIARISSPASGSWLPTSSFDLTAETSDAASGVKQVDFFYHSNQWQNSNWVALESDADGSDGWSIPFNPASYPEGQGLALYAQANDWAGNSIGTGAWNLGIDRTAPTSALAALPSTQNSTAVWLHWSGYDSLSGIDHYDVQVNPGSGWVDYAAGLPAGTSSTWYIAQPGKTYQFRMRAVDRAGNTELYPSAAEASISIPSNLCTNTQPYEPDNTRDQAKPISLGLSQLHSFCGQSSGGLFDEDWLTMRVEAGTVYQARVTPVSQDIAAQVTFYRLDGSGALVPLSSASASTFGQPTSLGWKVDFTGTLYIQVKQTNGNVAGSDVKYLVQAFKGYPLWMPFISK